MLFDAKTNYKPLPTLCRKQFAFRCGITRPQNFRITAEPSRIIISSASFLVDFLFALSRKLLIRVTGTKNSNLNYYESPRSRTSGINCQKCFFSCSSGETMTLTTCRYRFGDLTILYIFTQYVVMTSSSTSLCRPSLIHPLARWP